MTRPIPGRAGGAAALLLGLLLALLSAPAWAHKPSDSYLSFKVDERGVTGQWDIAFRDLEYAIGLDANGDGEISWGEVKQKHADIASYALARLEVKADGHPCTLKPAEHLVDDHTDGAYEVLRFAADCPGIAAGTTTAPAALDIRYNLFFDFDAQHKGLLRIESPAGTLTGVFASDSSSQHFELRSHTLLEQFGSFFREGVFHIWVGIDHVLFLISLLLPAVLFLPHGAHAGWRPVERLGPALWDVLRVVTSFTVAHSITLSLAALGIVSLPSRLVESTIAFSVLLAAINNIRPVVEEKRWLMAFLFGLIHGFGFASVLADLGLPRDALLLALVGFNLGVEAGQLVIVSVFVPLAFMLRATVFYRRVLMIGGSVIVALVAATWMAERIFDLKIITPR
ncbi:MAG TPA: HupE/UreJ family protein [Burkholderiales bacterium]|nr:HupE/UreJ family protein [Burkholderiales bacterium]